MFKFIFILVILFICAVIIPIKKYYENFEQVKIRLKQNPLNLNNQGSSSPPCNNYPDVIVPVYAPWKTYWPADIVYPYYPFYPYYYNNYYWPY